MKQNRSNSAKKGARRGVGQTVAAVVMALAVTVGGVGTTALLANQPVGLTVEPAAIQWESESTATQKPSKNNTKKPAVQADSKADDPAKAGSEAPASSEAKAEAAVTETKSEPTPEAPAASEARPAPVNAQRGNGPGERGKKSNGKNAPIKIRFGPADYCTFCTKIMRGAFFLQFSSCCLDRCMVS